MENPPGDSGVLSGSFRQPFTVIRTWWQFDWIGGRFKVTVITDCLQLWNHFVQTFPRHGYAQSERNSKIPGANFLGTGPASWGEWVSGKQRLFLPNTREYSRILENTREYSRILEDTGEYSRMPENTGWYWRILENTWECWRILENTIEYSKMPPMAQTLVQAARSISMQISAFLTSDN